MRVAGLYILYAKYMHDRLIGRFTCRKQCFSNPNSKCECPLSHRILFCVPTYITPTRLRLDSGITELKRIGPGSRSFSQSVGQSVNHSVPRPRCAALHSEHRSKNDNRSVNQATTQFFRIKPPCSQNKTIRQRDPGAQNHRAS